MTVSTALASRNSDFAAHGFRPELRMMPALRTIVIACVDPRVDPATVLGLEQGEAAVIRNVGGRVTPAVLSELAMLRAVTQAAGGDLGPGWELIVLHHTDCGITRLDGEPHLLADFFGVEPTALEQKSVSSPTDAVAVDMAALLADTRFPGVAVSGLVYDVSTGLVAQV